MKDGRLVCTCGAAEMLPDPDKAASWKMPPPVVKYLSTTSGPLIPMETAQTREREDGSAVLVLPPIWDVLADFGEKHKGCP